MCNLIAIAKYCWESVTMYGVATSEQKVLCIDTMSRGLNAITLISLDCYITLQETDIHSLHKCTHLHKLSRAHKPWYASELPGPILKTKTYSQCTAKWGGVWIVLSADVYPTFPGNGLHLRVRPLHTVRKSPTRLRVKEKKCRNKQVSLLHMQD